jgi:hypothetical protein
LGWFLDNSSTVEPQSSVLENDVIAESVIDSSGFGVNFQRAGLGVKTNEYCGNFSHNVGCSRVELHNLIASKGGMYKGKPIGKDKVFNHKVHFSCGKLSCPVCYTSAAVREARKVDGRLKEGSKRFGDVEHIMASLPKKDYGLSYEAMRKRVHEILAIRGVEGGNMIFHGHRGHLPNQYWSPHFHVLGFVSGGYARCRECNRKSNCLKGCGGFDDTSYQNFLKDGYYVKVLGKRKTVLGTAWYELTHASIDVTKKRFHVSTWFGVMGYRNFKVKVEKHKDACPICQYEVGKQRYNGMKHFCLDKDSPDYKSSSLEDYYEDGVPVWESVLTRQESYAISQSSDGSMRSKRRWGDG